MTEYKPLTPSLRQEINDGFDKTIAELRDCSPNALVNMQIEGLKISKQLISGLPDGYPMPMQSGK